MKMTLKGKGCQDFSVLNKGIILLGQVTLQVNKVWGFPLNWSERYKHEHNMAKHSRYQMVNKAKLKRKKIKSLVKIVMLILGSVARLAKSID